MSVPFTDGGLAAQVDQYRRLFAAGYTDFWSLEATGWDAFTPLSMVAAQLPEARFGTAIVPVFSRGAATLAGHAAAMSELIGDRFTLGIGASTPTIIENWNGLPYEDPFHRTKDTLTFLRQALAGEKVTEEYRTFSVKGFQLQRAADGAILSWVSVDDVPQIKEIVGVDKDIAARLFVCLSTDRERVLESARRNIAWYANAPAYRAFHEWCGRGEEFGPMWPKWDAGDRRGALGAIPESVVDALVVNGSPQECVQHSVFRPPVSTSRSSISIPSAPRTLKRPCCWRRQGARHEHRRPGSTPGTVDWRRVAFHDEGNSGDEPIDRRSTCRRRLL
ncbi:LLM class flavin-dependent oxidoreductase [Saccharopolyspora shandongensis]|uniref:LLM class flavin-dependent oxidoreductase n=1 Tax=Saccharopolyspora shandongensis TaxID=418495 RepID=UPI0033F719DE